MRYYISDLHFGHENILKFERTEFPSIQAHDDYIVYMINSIVKETDELMILGDVGNLDQVSRIKCRKYLLLGNHDTANMKKYLAYFAEVYTRPYYLKDNILLSHIPHPVTEDVLNVHGHLHGSRLASRNHLNLSAHIIGYRPLNEESLYQIAAALPKKQIRFLEEWYADMYVFDNASERNDVVTDETGRIKLQESRELRDTSQRDKSGYQIDVFNKGQTGPEWSPQ